MVRNRLPHRPFGRIPTAVPFVLLVLGCGAGALIDPAALPVDLILFADTGGEKPETYQYLPVVQRYLKGVGFPPVVTVRYGAVFGSYRTVTTGGNFTSFR